VFNISSCLTGQSTNLACKTVYKDSARIHGLLSLGLTLKKKKTTAISRDCWRKFPSHQRRIFFAAR